MSLKYAPTVQTEAGPVRGFIQEVEYVDGEQTGEVLLYQGIPYGKASRFEKPLPAEPWSEVFDATQVRANPPQLGLEIPYKGYYSTEYSEDCLLLNVWKPISKKEGETPEENLLPIMVYIYGGGYHTGSIFKITHDARYLAARGEVLVVMMNYRVGCLGWLYGGGGGDNGAAPANLGLADIHLALKWVQANGAHFGGDPSNVTLFGNSSGSVLTGLLLLSPATKGLFARVILQSGVPDSIRPAEEQLAVTRKFAKECGFEGGSSEAEMKEIVEFLKNKVSLETILAATKAMDNPFRPVYGADELVPVRPIEVLRSGRYNADVDILYGVCRDEGGAFTIDKCPELDDEKTILTIERTKEIFQELIGEHWAEEAFRFYAHRAKISAQEASLEELRELIMRAYGDYMMIASVLLFGEEVARRSRSLKSGGRRRKKAFAWMLTRPAAVHIAGICNGRDWLGVGHADELYFLFTILRQTNQPDRELSVAICEAFANFARSGDPGPEFGGVSWEEALEEEEEADENQKSKSTRLMALDLQAKMLASEYYAPVTAFWRDKLLI